MDERDGREIRVGFTRLTPETLDELLVRCEEMRRLWAGDEQVVGTG